MNPTPLQESTERDVLKEFLEPMGSTEKHSHVARIILLPPFFLEGRSPVETVLGELCVSGRRMERSTRFSRMEIRRIADRENLAISKRLPRFPIRACSALFPFDRTQSPVFLSRMEQGRGEIWEKGRPRQGPNQGLLQRFRGLDLQNNLAKMFALLHPSLGLRRVSKGKYRIDNGLESAIFKERQDLEQLPPSTHERSH